MKLFAVYWLSTSSRQADLIHKYDGRPSCALGHVRLVPGGRGRTLLVLKLGTSTTIRIRTGTSTEHSHRNGDVLGVDVPQHMPAVVGDNRPRTVHCCYVYLSQN